MGLNRQGSVWAVNGVLAEELSDVHGEVADDFAAIQMSENGSPRYSFTDLDSLDGELADFNGVFIADF